MKRRFLELKTWEVMVAVTGFGLFFGWIMMWESSRVEGREQTAERIAAERLHPAPWENRSEAELTSALRDTLDKTTYWPEPWDAETATRIIGSGLLIVVPFASLMHSAGRALAVAARSRGRHSGRQSVSIDTASPHPLDPGVDE